MELPTDQNGSERERGCGHDQESGANVGPFHSEENDYPGQPDGEAQEPGQGRSASRPEN